MNNQILSVDDAQNLTEKEIYRLHKKHTNPLLISLLEQVGFDRKVVSAEGSTLIYENGETALDFLAGYGSVPFGYQHQPSFLQTHQSGVAAALAYNLAQIAPGKINKFFFCNSGTEAVEGAIKAARAASNKVNILTTIGGFHGKTLGSLSASGKELYKEPFIPLVPGFDLVPYNDLDSLEAKFKNQQYAAFLLEPVQGEAGVNVPDSGYLKSVEKLCRKYNVFLILDEVQTGFGRTGKMFAAEHEGVSPDIIAIGKAMGGGEAPIAATGYTDAVYKKAYGSKIKCLLHTSTFGGNYAACCSALRTIERLLKDDLIAKVAELGQYALEKLQQIQQRHSIITKVKGQGLLLGVEFQKPADEGIKNSAFQGLEKMTGHLIDRNDLSSMIAGIMLREHGIHLAFTLNNPNVIRFEPALTITKQQIDIALNALDSTLNKYPTYSSILSTTIKYYAGSMLSTA